MLCRFTIIPDGGTLIYSGRPEDTYETALLYFGIKPDTALVFHNGKSLPQDKKIEEGEVVLFPTSSRG